MSNSSKSLNHLDFLKQKKGVRFNVPYILLIVVYYFKIHETENVPWLRVENL